MDPALIAWRPRRVAVAISWAGLVGVVIGLLSVGPLVASDGDGLPAAAALLAVGAGLPIATLLPRISRWYALRQGTVWIDAAGLIVRSAEGVQEIRVRWREVGGMDGTPRPASVLPPAAAALLGSGVRWRPGAHAAVARWSAEGFAPSLEEVRRLELDPALSDDPRADLPTLGERVRDALVQLWLLGVLTAMVVGAVYAVVVTDASWPILLMLGLPALLGLIILAPRAWRTWRTGNRAAHLDDDGWVDLLHGQGRIPWDHVDRIEVHDRAVVLVSTPEAPPFRDRDLGNRLNAAFERLLTGSRVRIRSAGPGFREIGPRHLPYSAGTGVHRLVRHASALGTVVVRRTEGLESLSPHLGHPDLSRRPQSASPWAASPRPAARPRR